MKNNRDRREREKGQKKIFKERVAGNAPNLMIKQQYSHS